MVNTDNSIQKLASLAKAHTMKMVGSSEIVIATNSGLFHFNTVNQVLSTLITGIEFNRRALYIHKNLIYAGSINGLYTININDFNQLISRNHTPIKKNSIPPYIQIPLLLAILVIALLSYLLFRSEKKLNAVKEQIEELNIDHLDRKQIEEFIQQNLPIASLKSITDHFKSNNSHIYKLIEPDKPGLIIQKLRADKVVEMKNAGCDISEISRVTGLSESYIKKIKAKPSSTA